LKRLKKVGTAQRVESSADTEVDAKVSKDADVQGRLEESQAKVYHLDLEHADKVLKVVTTTTPITTAPVPKAKKGEKEIEEGESKRKSENLEQKAAKKQKIDEDVEELKTHLQLSLMMKMMCILKLLL
nr:hypothetical protein [Tanacetum cinerariifolium]